MCKNLLFLLVALGLSSSMLWAQSETKLDAVAVRAIGTNHLWPLSSVDEWDSDDLTGGMEFEFYYQLNDLFDVSFPLRLGAALHSTTGQKDQRVRQGSLFGLNALLNMNLYRGEVFRPVLFTGVGTNLVDFDDFALDVPIGLGLNFYVSENAALSTSLAYHYNSIDYRDHLQLSFGFRVDLNQGEPKVTDRDGDGMLDNEDDCPDTPGLAALNGCPDADGDGITDASDACPQTAGIAKFDGCPDTDGDGVKDSEDVCPDVPGLVDNKGCPAADRDNDGVSDDADACPDQAGPASNQGCPEKSIVVTAKDKITGENIPGVTVNLLDASGKVVATTITNEAGVAQFENIAPGSYSLSGTIFDVDLQGTSVNASDFNAASVAKTLYYDDPNFIIQGKVFYCNSPNPLPRVTLNLKGTSQNFMKSTISDDQGRYIFYLDSKDTYDLYAQKESFLSQVVAISPSDYDRNTSVFVRLEVCAEEVECGEAVRLNNILYDTGSAAIRADAMPDLNKVVQFMRDNKDAKVELSSHTDSRGRASSNQSLSQRRAQSAADYIVAQGISRDRILATGYGETQLLNRCADGVNCSDTEHQQNRRTEFKVICPD